MTLVTHGPDTSTHAPRSWVVEELPERRVLAQAVGETKSQAARMLHGSGDPDQW
jgi:hypothetical protein